MADCSSSISETVADISTSEMNVMSPITPVTQPILPPDLAHEKSGIQPKLSSYPRTQQKDQFQSFNSRWYNDYPFLEYSVQRDAIFCFSCRLFPSSSHKAESTFTS